MTSNNHSNTNAKAENVLQPVIYGVLPDQTGDEIDLGELFSRLTSQWKLIFGITAGGCLLAVLIALSLPKVYQPSVTVSVPPAANIAAIIDINTLLGANSISAATRAELSSQFSERQMTTINTLLGGNNAIPATSQEVFNRFFNLFRSAKTLENYINKKQYMKKLYPDSEKPSSVLFANLLKNWSVEIIEPKPQTRGGYIGNPKRVKISLLVKDEATGASLLNDYIDFANHQLIKDFQNNAKKIIVGRINVLNDQVAKQREQYKLSRLLTIKKIEQENAKKIAVLQEQINATLKKAELARQTRIAKAEEALSMAKVLGVTNPSTMDIMAKKDLKGKLSGTSFTVVDKQSIPLYLYGSKYLTMLIETLKSRKDDAVFLNNINDLKEKIHIIENDAVLAALKSRKSDDPWIEGLAGKLVKIDAMKELTPDFENVQAYTLDNPAIVSDKSIKPKRKLIVALGLVLSLFVGVFVALVMGSRYGGKQVA